MNSETIEKNGKTYAIIVYSDTPVDNVKFFTSEEHTLQVGVHNKEKNSTIQPHIHKDVLRTIKDTEEFLHIDKGKLLVEIFDETKKKIAEKILQEGDSILFIQGGHGFKMLEDTKIIEVKQGPYLGNKDDKERFEVKK